MAPGSTFCFPNSFNPELYTKLFYRPAHIRWEWLETILSNQSPGVIIHLPPWWQLLPLIAKACNNAHSFTFHAPDKNLPITVRAVHDLSIRTMITTPEYALEAYTAIGKTGGPTIPMSMIFFLPIESFNTVTAYPFRSYSSYQVFPGLPVLEECQSTGVYHTPPGITIELQKESAQFGNFENVSPPVHTLTLPVRITEKMCICGRNGYTRNHA